MKRFWNAGLMLALILALTACGGGEKAEGYETGDVRAMADAGAFSEELEELEVQIAFGLYRLEDYGLKQENVTACAVLRSAGATCEEGAVLVLDSAEHARTAGDALKDYISGQIDENKDYRPAEIPKLEKAYIDVRENTVLLAVADDLDAAKKAVE